MTRLRTVAANWLAPAAVGLGCAALLIAGLEAGGWIARASLTAAWVGLAAVVVWGFRLTAAIERDLAAWPDLDDDQPADP